MRRPDNRSVFCSVYNRWFCKVLVQYTNYIWCMETASYLPKLSFSNATCLPKKCVVKILSGNKIFNACNRNKYSYPMFTQHWRGTYIQLQICGNFFYWQYETSYSWSVYEKLILLVLLESVHFLQFLLVEKKLLLEPSRPSLIAWPEFHVPWFLHLMSLQVAESFASSRQRSLSPKRRSYTLSLRTC